MREIDEIRGSTQQSFGINYSYLRHKEQYINLYEVQNPQFTDFIDLTIKKYDDLKNTVAVVMLDVTRIGSIIEDLETWLTCLKKEVDRISEQMSEDQVSKMKSNLNERFKNVKHPENIKHNLGFPVIIVLCKSDMIWKVAEDNHQQQYAFDFLNPGEVSQYLLNFLQLCLRRKALQFGASIVYTSTKEEFTNCKLLYDLIMHLQLGEEFKYPAERKQHTSVFIPFGFDTKLLIADLKVEHLVKKPDETKFKDIVKVRDEKQKGQIPLVRSKKKKNPSFQKFLKMQKSLLIFQSGGKDRQVRTPRVPKIPSFEPKPIVAAMPKSKAPKKSTDRDKTKEKLLNGFPDSLKKPKAKQKSFNIPDIPPRSKAKKSSKKKADKADKDEKDEMESFFTKMLEKLNNKKKK